MLKNTETEPILFLVLLICALVALIVILIYTRKVIPFLNERDYLRREIARATRPEEYIRWKRRLRRLYISAIPILGKFLLKKKGSL